MNRYFKKSGLNDIEKDIRLMIHESFLKIPKFPMTENDRVIPNKRRSYASLCRYHQVQCLSHDPVLDISDGKKCFLHQQKIVEHEKS